MTNGKQDKKTYSNHKNLAKTYTTSSFCYNKNSTSCLVLQQYISGLPGCDGPKMPNHSSKYSNLVIPSKNAKQINAG